LYAYVKGQALRGIDPLGLECGVDQSCQPPPEKNVVVEAGNEGVDVNFVSDEAVASCGTGEYCNVKGEVVDETIAREREKRDENETVMDHWRAKNAENQVKYEQQVAEEQRRAEEQESVLGTTVIGMGLQLEGSDGLAGEASFGLYRQFGTAEVYAEGTTPSGRMTTWAAVQLDPKFVHGRGATLAPFVGVWRDRESAHDSTALSIDIGPFEGALYFKKHEPNALWGSSPAGASLKYEWIGKDMKLSHAPAIVYDGPEVIYPLVIEH
jgi:hypothetical protein